LTGNLSHTSNTMDGMPQAVATAAEQIADYAGLTMDVIDPQTGVVNTAQIFVAALGASSYTFACAVQSQDLSLLRRSQRHPHVRQP